MATIAKPNYLALLTPAVQSLYSRAKEIIMAKMCFVVEQRKINAALKRQETRNLFIPYND